MANTTDIMITTLFDEVAIDYINHNTGLDLLLISDGSKSGGCKVLSFDSFGTCPRSIGMEKITQLIEIFKSAPFTSPEYAVLLIDDDNEDFNGIITIG